jgi:putative transposase
MDSFISYHERKIWWGELILVMPDHIHAILQPSAKSLTESVKSWKRYLSKKNEVKWQKGWFDHRLRANESYSQKFDYIIENPIRAGLAEEPLQWPYWWKPNPQNASNAEA